MATKLSRKHGLAGGLAALLVIGALFGTAVAQQAGRTDQPAPSPTVGRHAGAAQHNRFDLFLSKLAANLNTDEQTVRNAMVKSEQALVDAAVQNGRLTQARADQIKQRIQQTGGRPFFHGPGAGPHGAVRETVISAAANALGLSPDQLRTQLTGKTLTQLAQERGTDPNAVKQALLSALQSRLNQAVSSGVITGERAQQIQTHLTQHVDRLMSRTFGPGQPGPAGGTHPRFGGPGRAGRVQ